MKFADLVPVAAAVGLLLIGCTDQPVEPGPPGISVTAPPPHAGGGGNGGGGGGDNGSASAGLQGGMSAASQSVAPTETGSQLGIDATTYAVTMNLASLVTDASIGACRQEPDPLPPDILQVLRDRLAGATHAGSFFLTVDKQAAAGGVPSVDNVLALRDDLWLQLGKNHDRIGAGWPTIVFEGPGTIDDATQTRVFRITNASGDVRVVQRYDGNNDGKLRGNDPVGHLTCPLSNMDAAGIEITIAPAS